MVIFLRDGGTNFSKSNRASANLGRLLIIARPMAVSGAKPVYYTRMQPDKVELKLPRTLSANSISP